jgi:hypothetical protein
MISGLSDQAISNPPDPSTMAARLEPVFERLEDLSKLELDWDACGGEPPSPRAVATAARLIVAVIDRLGIRAGDRALPFEIMPIVDGGLQVEWRGAAGKVQLNVGPDSAISFLHVVGRGRDRRSVEGDDLPLSSAVELAERVALS